MRRGLPFRTEISIPRTVRYGKIEYKQRWLMPSKDRVNKFIEDLKNIPDYSSYLFVISGSFLSLLAGKNTRPIWDLDFIIVGDRDLQYESIKNTMLSVIEIGCGKHKIQMDTYFMYLDDYINQGTSSICSPSNEILNQYKRNSGIKIGSITKTTLSSWNTMSINGKDSPHAVIKKEIHPGLWLCEKYLPTDKHAMRLDRGEFFGEELLVEEYLSKYQG